MLINNQDIKILIVDDQPSNLRFLSNLLTQRGYKVQRSISASMVVNAEFTSPPNLILLDIVMPEMDGYEVCRKLKAKEITRDIPVIFLSVLKEPFDKVKAFGVGGVDYITKPFEVEEVLARIENQLTIQQLSKKLKEQNEQLQQEIEVRKQTEIALRQSEAREREKAQQLERTLNELKQTQVQLIHSEKMSGLAQMVAGVAHEINNPVSFIYGNLYLARQYLQDLIDLIELYQQISPNTTPEIERRIAEIELDFLREDCKEMFDSMQGGAERIRQIILSLQTFSALNHSDIKSIDIHQGIDHALNLLKHRLSGESKSHDIKVIKDYDQLPIVTCYAGQLNQVFMNLLDNAIDVLKTQPYGRVIRISTSVGRWRNSHKIAKEQVQLPPNECRLNPYITIRIADNGPGISEDVLQKIFDPFFTTKPVGSGRGLGLSISYQIVVDKHGGQITCNSVIGRGTEFVILLPIVPKVSDTMPKAKVMTKKNEYVLLRTFGKF